MHNDKLKRVYTEVRMKTLTIALSQSFHYEKLKNETKNVDLRKKKTQIHMDIYM